MAKQDASIGRNWYVINTYSGHEESVKKAIEHRIESFGMQEYVFELIIPYEEVEVVRHKKRIVEKKKLFPGYILIDMIVTDASWFMVRNTPGVSGFVGSGNIPVPVLPEEYGIIRRRMDTKTPKSDIKLAKNDLIKITEGPFKDYTGKISEVNAARGMVTVRVNIFDRDTPLELGFDQVVKKI